MIQHLLGQWFVVFFALALTGSRNPIWGDASVACGAMNNLFHHGSPLPEERSSLEKRMNLASQEIDAVKYPLLYTAACFLPTSTQAFLTTFGINKPQLVTWSAAAVASAIGASLAVGMTYLFSLLGANLVWALILGFAGIFASPLWHYSRILYSEGLQALILCLMAIAWHQFATSEHRRWALLYGLWFGLALNIKLIFLVLAPLPLLVLFIKRESLVERVKRFAPYAGLGFLPGLTLMLWYNYVRFGDAFFTRSYSNGPAGRDGAIGFISPWSTGLFGIFLSPGKSIFLYCPLLILALFLWKKLWGKHQSSTLFVAFAGSAVILAHAKFYTWSGDWAWAARYAVPVTPLLLAPLALWNLGDRSKRVWIFGAAAFGFGVNLLGIVFNPNIYMRMIFRMLAPIFSGSNPTYLRDDIFALHYIPDFSPILAHWWFLKNALFGPSHFEDYPWVTMGVKAWIPNPSSLPREYDFWLAADPLNIGVAIVLGIGLLVSLRFLLRAIRDRKREIPNERAQSCLVSPS